MTATKTNIQYVSVLVLFFIAGFMLYCPILNNTFLSDDYDSLYRIVVEKRILFREFLRPMIDISFYFNYFFSGLSPRSFYVFNITVHVLNCLLLFRFAYTLKTHGQEQFQFALFAAFLFLIYPFHNESIVWLSGRLSSMACFFALLAIVLSNKRSGRGFSFTAAGCYLIGLLCYESIIVLPLIILTLNRRQYRAEKKLSLYGLYWATATAIYFIARAWLAAGFTGAYGSRVMDNNIISKIGNTGKVLGRLFLPPAEQSFLLVTIGALLLLVLIVLHRAFRKKTMHSPQAGLYVSSWVCLAFSLLVPVAFGVSTRTSESDRLLYFPSVFLCLVLANWLLVLCKSRPYQWLALFGLTIYCVWFLEQNNRQWQKASDAAQVIMTALKSNPSFDVVLINIPNELEGAFVFRNGFQKALHINHINPQAVTVINFLTRNDYLETGNTIVPVNKKTGLFIFPSTYLVSQAQGHFSLTSALNNTTIAVEKNRNLVFYWNKQALVRLF